MARNSMENVVATCCLLLGTWGISSYFSFAQVIAELSPSLSLSLDDAYLCEMLAKVPGLG